MLYISETCIPVHSCLAIFCALHFFHQVADRRDSSLHWSPSHKGQGTLAQNPYETNSIQFLKYYYIILYYIHGRVAYGGGRHWDSPPSIKVLLIIIDYIIIIVCPSVHYGRSAKVIWTPYHKRLYLWPSIIRSYNQAISMSANLGTSYRHECQTVQNQATNGDFHSVACSWVSSSIREKTWSEWTSRR